MVLELTAITAMSDSNRGIGKNNDLPWSIFEDWKYFLRFISTTQNKNKVNALIMGRKSWESATDACSLFKPCVVVILSSSLKPEDLNLSNPEDYKNILIAKTFESALEILNAEYSHKVEKIIAAGGTNIYKMSFISDCLKKLFLTRVFGSFECDVFLEPEDFLKGFTKVESDSLQQETQAYECEYNVMKRDPVSAIEYIFEVYQKK